MTFVYADDATRELLGASDRIVYLYGGFEGYENYGDVLQLKSVIRFHRERTGRSPVLVCALSAWNDVGLLDEIRAKYDLDGVVFEDDELLDARGQGLGLLREVRQGNLFHFYGGGYFNQYWGARRVAVGRNLIETLGITRYVVSGIQVDEVGAQHLAGLFAHHPPALVGARDESSRQLLEPGVPADRLDFSFDDAVESIDDVAQRLAVAAPASGGPTTMGLHMNVTTEYMSSDQAQEIRRTLHAVDAAHPLHALTLLHAYNDRRALVRDTLESASVLGVSAANPSFEVVNLATISANPDLPASVLARAGSAISAIDFVVSSSYHVSLTMNLLGRATFLVATNGYYRDKRAALGLPQDLDAFLEKPADFVRDYSTERSARLGWLDRLAAVCGEESVSSSAQKIKKPFARASRTVAAKYFLP